MVFINEEPALDTIGEEYEELFIMYSQNYLGIPI